MTVDLQTACPDYNLRVRVRNARLLRLMREHGHETVAELSRASGVTQTLIGEWLNLKRAPIRQSGRWSAPVIKLSEYFRCLPEDMFPPQHIEQPLKQGTAEVELSADDIAPFLENARKMALPPSEALEQRERDEALYEAIGELTEREQYVLRVRFGLEGEPELKLDEVAKKIGVTAARARQIEQNAMRKIRRQSSVGRLAEAIADDVKSARDKREALSS